MQEIYDRLAATQVVIPLIPWLIMMGILLYGTIRYALRPGYQAWRVTLRDDEEEKVLEGYSANARKADQIARQILDMSNELQELKIRSNQMERWERHQKHNYSRDQVYRRLGYVTEHGKFVKFNGPEFYPLWEALGHTHVEFDKCDCASEQEPSRSRAQHTRHV